MNQILFEDLDGIVLLGFSYGGMVVTGALEHIADRVEHVVYLDAFVPGNGQAVADFVDLAVAPRAPGDTWSLPPTPRDVDDPATTDWVNARRVAQTRSTFTEGVRLARPLEAFPFGRTYIKATAEPPDHDPFLTFAERLRDDPAWSYREIETTHMIPENRAEQLSAIPQDIPSSCP